MLETLLVTRRLQCLACAVVLNACGSGGSSHRDGAVDRARDLQPDGGLEGGPEARPDVPPDTGPDVPPAATPSIAPWRLRDIGPATGPAGRVTYTNTIFAMRAAGGDVGGTEDSFDFMYQKLSGDFEFIARVRSLTMVDPGSKSGLMVRADESSPGAPNVFLTVLGDTAVGGRMQARLLGDGETTPFAANTNVKAAQFLRLVRQGKTVTGYRSTGSRGNWAKVGAVDIDLPSEVAVGIAVTSNNPATMATSEIDFLQVNNLGLNAATTGWMFDEFESVGGSAVATPTGLTVSGLGSAFSGMQEAGAYAFTTASASQSIVAKVGSLIGVDAQAKVGLAMREGVPLNLPRNAVQVLLSVTVGRGVQFISRSVTNGTVRAEAGEADRKAPVWLRLDKKDDAMTLVSTFTGYVSADGMTWTSVGTTSFAMQEPFTLGVLAQSHSVQSLASAAITDLTVKPIP